MSADRSPAAARETLATGGKAGCVPEFWGGRCAERIAAHLHGWLVEHEAARAGAGGRDG